MTFVLGTYGSTKQTRSDWQNHNPKYTQERSCARGAYRVLGAVGTELTDSMGRRVCGSDSQGQDVADSAWNGSVVSSSDSSHHRHQAMWTGGPSLDPKIRQTESPCPEKGRHHRTSMPTVARSYCNHI